MFCSKCGNNLPDTVRFCNKCGWQVKGNIDEKDSRKNKRNYKFICVGCGIFALFIAAIVVINNNEEVPQRLEKVIFYDEEGNVVDEEIYRYEYVYDRRGNLLEEKRFIGENTYDSRNICKYVYNEQNMLIQELFYGDDDTLDKSYEYDLEGKLWRETLYDSWSGEIDTIYEYDSSGSVIKWTNYEDGSIEEFIEIKHEYDATGKRVRSEIVDFMGNPDYRWNEQFEYCNNDNIYKEEISHKRERGLL